MSKFLHSPEVCVVEASAGSGKTYTLAKRYVQLLLSSCLTTPLAFKHILAITFTNKAALEMKGRILDLLKRIALGALSPDEEKDILSPLGLNAFKAQGLALRVMDDLIRHYHYFGILTIDSFMNMLLCGCAFRIHLSARFKIRRSAVDYLQLSIDELIDKSYQQKPLRDLFNDFIRQYLFLENRSGWFPKKDLLRVLTTLFNQHNTYQVPFVLFEEGHENVLSAKQDFLEHLQELQVMLPESTDKRFLSSLEKFLHEHRHGFDIDAVSRYFARPQPPLTAEAVPSDALERLWQRCGAILNLICLRESYAVFNPYLRLYNEAAAILGQLQTKDDILFLGQLNKKAGDLFNDGQMTMEELFYRLATRYRHYLIDEFQDTSYAQWHNLQAMVEEALSTGGSLFFVGDKKQAIYSFRGGQSRLFDELKERYKDFHVLVHTLHKNYRSQANIVHFNNRLFSVEHLLSFMDVLQAQERMKDKDIVFTAQDKDRLMQVFNGAKQEAQPHLPHGLVCVQMVGSAKKEARLDETKEKVLAVLTQVLARFEKADVAILTRNNEEVRQVTQWLMQAGVPAQSERTSDIKAHPLINELASLLRFLNDPSDNLFFADFILGDIFLQASGLSCCEIQGFIFHCHQQRSLKTEVTLYQLFKEAYPDIWRSVFHDCFNQRGIYPLYELMVSVLKRLRCLEFFPHAQDFIMHWLELIKRKEEESCDIESFLAYFDDINEEDRYVPSPQHDAVRVLTVHKSKGLEFPVVIIPFLEMPIKAGTSDRDGGQSFVWDLEEDGMHLMRLKESYARFSPLLKERYAQELKESFFAELNNVYVALTRAVWEMHIFVPARVGNSANPALLLFGSEGHVQGQALKPPKHMPVAQQQYLPALPGGDWIGLLEEEFIKDRVGSNKARLKGDILHYCLAQLKVVTEENVGQSVAQAVEAALRYYGNAVEAKGLREHIMELLHRPAWRKYFYLTGTVVVLCEQELVNRFGDTRRVDRMIILPQAIMIVDFKHSRLEHAAHQRQLEEYIRLAKDIYPKHGIKGELLYIDD